VFPINIQGGIYQGGWGGGVDPLVEFIHLLLTCYFLYGINLWFLHANFLKIWADPLAFLDKYLTVNISYRYITNIKIYKAALTLTLYPNPNLNPKP
jgi:hypothetical protein